MVTATGLSYYTHQIRFDADMIMMLSEFGDRAVLEHDTDMRILRM